MTAKKDQVFLLEDDTEMRAAMTQWLELYDYHVRSFSEAPTALDLLNADFKGVVVSDVRMPKMNGMEFLRHLNALDQDIPVLLVTAHGDVQMAVEAMRQGAYDFIEKPFEPERLLEVVHRACEKRRLVMENRELRQRLTGSAAVEQRLIGNSAEIKSLREQVLDLVDTDATVLLRGETGTGKEVVARCLHEFSSRHEGRYVAVNCGAVPENIFESELFGHERGAFTGADRQRIGRFEYARGGVLFLDEIGTLPLPLQVKLLRVLQEGEVVMVGGNEPRALDVRLICATNKDLLRECAEGRFREDLYYRINLVELIIPPLRDRGGDILMLFDYFSAQAASTYQRPEVSLPESDISLLLSHDWPGNVRELKNIAERYVLSSVPQKRRLSAIFPHACEPAESTPKQQSLQALMHQYERRLLEQALIRHKGDVQSVMEALELPRRTLNEKMTRYHLERKDYV